MIIKQNQIKYENKTNKTQTILKHMKQTKHKRKTNKNDFNISLYFNITIILK